MSDVEEQEKREGIWNGIGRGFWNLLFPRRCPICDQALPAGQEAVCGACRQYVSPLAEDIPRCRKCGKPLEDEEEYCLDCQGKRTSYDYGYGAYLYDSRMQEAVGRLKYNGRKEYARIFAREMYERYGAWMKKTGAQALIPVPVHRKRYRQRGYNQSALLARELSRYSGIPVWEDYLLRVRDTLPQKDLSPGERKQNLVGAFQIDPVQLELKPKPECVIIIDDIYTTGSTIDACSVQMKTQGVKRIYFLCLCVGKGY